MIKKGTDKHSRYLAAPVYMKYKKMHFAEQLIEYYQCKWKNIAQKRQQKNKQKQNITS